MIKLQISVARLLMFCMNVFLGTIQRALNELISFYEYNERQHTATNTSQQTTHKAFKKPKTKNPYLPQNSERVITSPETLAASKSFVYRFVLFIPDN